MANYVDNERFRQLLIQYKKHKKMSDYNSIGEIFLLIATNLLNRPNFVGYTDDRKEDMISDAVYFMCKYIDRFKVQRKYPFSYFTQIAKNAFLQYVNERKRYDATFKSIEYIDNAEEKDINNL